VRVLSYIVVLSMVGKLHFGDAGQVLRSLAVWRSPVKAWGTCCGCGRMVAGGAEWAEVLRRPS
jgi:hypothetical protein